VGIVVTDRIVAEFETSEGKLVQIIADLGEETFSVVSDGEETQSCLFPHDIIRYLANAAHNANHLAAKSITIKQRAAAEAVVLAAWTDRFSRLHGHTTVEALDRALKTDASNIVYQIEAYCPAEPDNLSLEKEDGGAALIFRPAFASAEDAKQQNFLSKNESEYGMFVRVQSYDERVWINDPAAHGEFGSILGKRVRITVEEVE
jgi:hypothetical protein